MSRLTRAEATEFLEAMLGCSIDMIGTGCVEAFTVEASQDEVRHAIGALSEARGEEVEGITLSFAEVAGMIGVKIFILTEAA